MILGTHNTMSYLPPRTIWGKLLRPFARCQSKTLDEQIEAAVRCFDLRVHFPHLSLKLYQQGAYGRGFDPLAFTEFAHGAVKFTQNVNLRDVLEMINEKTKGEKVIVRVILERCSSKAEKTFFYRICELIEEVYPDIIFIGGRSKKGWELIYSFPANKDYPGETIAQQVGSMAPDARWYEKIIPRLYAARCRRKFPDNPEGAKIILRDFV